MFQGWTESLTFASELLQSLRLAPNQSQELSLQFLMVNSILRDHQAIRGEINQQAQLWEQKRIVRPGDAPHLAMIDPGSPREEGNPGLVAKAISLGVSEVWNRPRMQQVSQDGQAPWHRSAWGKGHAERPSSLLRVHTHDLLLAEIGRENRPHTLPKAQPFCTPGLFLPASSAEGVMQEALP